MASQVAMAWSQAQAVRLARDILSGHVGLLEGCIPLASVAHDAVPDWRVDEDFVVFGAISSEITDLPFGQVRQRWSNGALARADLEIARYTETVRDRVYGACRNVIERFSSVRVEKERGDGAV